MKIIIKIQGYGGLVWLFQNNHLITQIFSYVSMYSGAYHFRNKKFRTTKRLPKSIELSGSHED